MRKDIFNYPFPSRSMFENRTGYTYFIQMDRIGPIKIGYSKDFGQRLIQLQTSNPYPLKLLCYYPSTEEHEKAWHYTFENIRMEGEWFLPHPRLIKVIEDEIEYNKRIEEDNDIGMRLGDWTLGSENWEKSERPDEADAIKKIEQRTKEEVLLLLQEKGIGNGDRKYEKAKKLCFEGLFIDCDIYDKQIGWICNYLGI